MRKPTLRYVSLSKPQFNLSICAFRSQYSLSTWKNFTSLAIHNAPNEDSDQIARIRMMIQIFAGRTCPKGYVFWSCNSIIFILRHWNGRGVLARWHNILRCRIYASWLMRKRRERRVRHIVLFKTNLVRKSSGGYLCNRCFNFEPQRWKTYFWTFAPSDYSR